MTHRAAVVGFVVAGIVLAPMLVARETPGAEALPPPLEGYPMPPWWPTEVIPSRGGPTPTFEDQVMELVNSERWTNGQLPPLKRDGLLDASSELHSQNMATRNFFAHCDPDTMTWPWDRMVAAGYAWSTAAENVAGGQSTPAAVMTEWMDSSGHRANILSTTSREVGIGYVLDGADVANVRVNVTNDCTTDFTDGPYFHYWTQNFGSRSTVYPVVIDREALSTPDPSVDLYLYGIDWATEMRIRNAGAAWGAWQPFASDVAWTLSGSTGFHTVEVEIRNGGTVRSAEDQIYLEQGADEIFLDGFESGNTSAWSSTS